MSREKKTPKKTHKREELVQAALLSVQRKGLKGLSFRSLAAEVGVKSSSVHYYFPEKSDLAFSLIQHYSDSFAAALSSIAEDENTSLSQKLDGFIELFSQTARDNKMCLCGMMAAEIDQLNDKSQALLGNYFVASEHWLTQLLGSSSIKLNTEVAPELLAKGLMSGLEGALLIDRVHGGTTHQEAQRQIAHSWLIAD